MLVIVGCWLVIVSSDFTMNVAKVMLSPVKLEILFQKWGVIVTHNIR